MQLNRISFCRVESKRIYKRSKLVFQSSLNVNEIVTKTYHQNTSSINSSKWENQKRFYNQTRFGVTYIQNIYIVYIHPHKSIRQSQCRAVSRGHNEWPVDSFNAIFLHKTSLQRFHFLTLTYVGCYNVIKNAQESKRKINEFQSISFANYLTFLLQNRSMGSQCHDCFYKDLFLK